MRQFRPVALLLCLACSPTALLAQDSADEPTTIDEPTPADETGEIDASTLHNNHASDATGEDQSVQTDNAGSVQTTDNSAGWTTTRSETSTSSSSTSVSIGDDPNEYGFPPPVRDDNYWEAVLAGRWLLQGDNASCTVTLTSTKWGSSGYRFNGPAGCPSSFIGGVSWALEGGRLVVRAPVSPLGTFRERSPNRWEGRDKDGNRLTLTR